MEVATEYRFKDLVSGREYNIDKNGNYISPKGGYMVAKKKLEHLTPMSAEDYALSPDTDTEYEKRPFFGTIHQGVESQYERLKNIAGKNPNRFFTVGGYKMKKSPAFATDISEKIDDVTDALTSGLLNRQEAIWGNDQGTSFYMAKLAREASEMGLTGDQIRGFVISKLKKNPKLLDTLLQEDTNLPEVEWVDPEDLI